MKTTFLVVALLAITSVGCGSSDVIKPTDEQNAFAAIEGLGDVSGDEAAFTQAFVAGSAPENRKDYSVRGYQVAGDATFSGDTVTVPIKIFGGVFATGADDRGSGKPSAIAETQQVWTLQRVDDQWKIKDAPLG